METNTHKSQVVRDPQAQRSADPDHALIKNNPPRELLRNYPILMRHWFGMDQEVAQCR